MSNTGTSAAAEKKKGGAGKTFLSVLFFILILACASVFAVCIYADAMNQTAVGKNILSECAAVLGGNVVDFVTGSLGFWCAFSAVVLWFGLWVVTTRRIASAIRGLGIACSIAALVPLAGSLILLLLTCVFSVDSMLLSYEDALPALFVDTCGNIVIFVLSSMLIAAFGIFICKLKKLPKKSVQKAIPEAEKEPVPVAAAAAVSQPASQHISTIDIDVTEKPVEEPVSAPEDEKGSEPDELPKEFEGICPVCGARNEPNVKFCGSCGTKLI